MARERGDTSISSRPPAFTLHDLRYAVAAADSGSFRRAAEALRVQQSTLSRCIRQLEDSVGISLFDRSSGGVRATRAGRAFLHSARNILEQVDALLTTAQSIGRGDVGRVRVGFHSSLSAGALRATLLDYSRRCPQVDIDMIEGSRTRLAALLRDGAIDIVIATGETPPIESNSMRLWSEGIVVALPDHHVLAARANLSWIDLRDETILMGESDTGAALQNMMIAKLAKAGEPPKIVLHDVSRGSIKGLVGAGFGISLMTEASLGATFVGISYRELIDDNGPILIDYLAHWRDDNDNPALANFLTLLRERYSLPAESE
jgi:DNA-binding transcriptional LysR family regulator